MSSIKMYQKTILRESKIQNFWSGMFHLELLENALEAMYEESKISEHHIIVKYLGMNRV